MQYNANDIFSRTTPHYVIQRKGSMSMRKNHRAGAAVKRNSVHNRCGGCQKYVIQEQGGQK